MDSYFLFLCKICWSIATLNWVSYLGTLLTSNHYFIRNSRSFIAVLLINASKLHWSRLIQVVSPSVITNTVTANKNCVTSWIPPSRTVSRLEAGSEKISHTPTDKNEIMLLKAKHDRLKSNLCLWNSFKRQNKYVFVNVEPKT